MRFSEHCPRLVIVGSTLQKTIVSTNLNSIYAVLHNLVKYDALGILILSFYR